jgi:prephenate dehydrogenase
VFESPATIKDAAKADIVILAVPWAAHADAVAALAPWDFRNLRYVFATVSQASVFKTARSCHTKGCVTQIYLTLNKRRSFFFFPVASV